MKIRIKGNSVRYRLSKSDIDQLTSLGQVSEAVEFSVQPFKYELKAAAADAVTVTYTDHTITVFIPRAWVFGFHDPAQVGFQADDNKITILVEKDFVCLDETNEDQSDFFPHPGGAIC